MISSDGDGEITFPPKSNLFFFGLALGGAFCTLRSGSGEIKMGFSKYRINILDTSEQYDLGFRDLIIFLNSRYWKVIYPFTDKITFPYVRKIACLEPNQKYCSMMFNYVIQRFF